jgi:cyclic pyranopterin phosphate synthase
VSVEPNPIPLLPSDLPKVGGQLYGEPRTSEPAPEDGPLLDTFGRIAGDLRISVTDRCNFRCTYCMPAEGLPWVPRSEIMTFEEIVTFMSLFASLGVSAIKITGGEPTVRTDLPRLIAMLKDACPGLEISMTTNGYLLDKLAVPLKEAGMDRVTVSCDSLLQHRFAEMTRRDALHRVLQGMQAAEAAGLTPIKINCVMIAGTNDDEVVDFARFARETGYEVRFIEYMPLDAEHAWERAKVLPSAKVIEAIHAVFPLIPEEPVTTPAEGDGTPPATSYRFADGGAGGVGVIPSVSEPFCDTCNRLRLTAEGKFRVCLFSLNEVDLLTPLRAGASVGDVERLIRQAVWAKWQGHKINHPDFERPDRSMSMIGG